MVSNTADLDSWTTTNELTIAFWFYANTILDNTFAGLVSKRDDFSPYDWEIYLDSYDDPYSIGMSVKGDGIINFRGNVNNVTITDSTWYHVVITYNSTTKAANIYVNNAGTPASETLSGAGEGTGDNIYIGILDPTETLNFDGKVCDLMIWNKILTPSEIEEVYTNEFTHSSSSSSSCSSSSSSSCSCSSSTSFSSESSSLSQSSTLLESMLMDDDEEFVIE